MRRAFHRALVFTVAVALVASAAAWRQCTGLQLAAAVAAISIEHDSHIAAHHAQMTGLGEHQGMHHHHSADDAATPAIPATDDHGCMKCCAICTVATTLPPAINVDVTFIVSLYVFSRNHETWSGRTVAVDPGIPKHIA